MDSQGITSLAFLRDPKRSMEDVENQLQQLGFTSYAAAADVILRASASVREGHQVRGFRQYLLQSLEEAFCVMAITGLGYVSPAVARLLAAIEANQSLALAYGYLKLPAFYLAAFLKNFQFRRWTGETETWSEWRPYPIDLGPSGLAVAPLLMSLLRGQKPRLWAERGQLYCFDCSYVPTRTIDVTALVFGILRKDLAEAALRVLSGGRTRLFFEIESPAGENRITTLLEWARIYEEALAAAAEAELSPIGRELHRHGAQVCASCPNLCESFVGLLGASEFDLFLQMTSAGAKAGIKEFAALAAAERKEKIVPAFDLSA